MLNFVHRLALVLVPFHMSCHVCDHLVSSVVTAKLPSGDDPIEKLEKGGNTPQESAKCVLHALKAVRDGEDPASAIKKFVNQCNNVTEKASKENDPNEITKLSSNLTKIVISEHNVAANKNDTVETPATPMEPMGATEIEALKEENEKLKEALEAFEAMKEEHQAKIRECKTLTQERERLSKHYNYRIYVNYNVL